MHIYYKRRVCALFLLISVHFALDAGAQSANRDIYMVRYSTNGWLLEISVNGVPEIHEDKGGGQLPIENLLSDGANSLRIRATQTDENASELQILLLLKDGSSGKDTVISKLSEPAAKPAAIVDKTIDFKAEIPVHWVWEDAENVNALTAVDKSQIMQLISSLAESMNKKDKEQYNKLRAVLIEEASKFQGIDPDKVAAALDAQDTKPVPEGLVWRTKKQDQLNIESFGKITVVSSRQPSPDDWVITMKVSENANRSFDTFLFAKIKGRWAMIN